MLAAQCFMLAVSARWRSAPMLGLLTPWLLLGFTFLIGCGTALNNPSWQASVGDMVPRDDLPAAVALNSVGFNLTRSVGPAIGGAIVAAAGAAAAFAVNALSYCRADRRARPLEAARCRPARCRASRSAARCGRACAMWRCRPTSARCCCAASSSASPPIAVLALLPLVARDLIEGGPLTLRPAARRLRRRRGRRRLPRRPPARRVCRARRSCASPSSASRFGAPSRRSAPAPG